MSSDHIFVGIDAGINCGVAAWNRTLKKYLFIDTFSFWGCVDKLKETIDFCHSNNYRITVIIEDVTQKKITFHRDASSKGMQKISRNVGGVMAYTTLLIEWCNRNGIQLIKSQPSKSSFTKLESAAFKNITKWEKRTNSHERDAAMLVFNK